MSSRACVPRISRLSRITVSGRIRLDGAHEGAIDPAQPPSVPRIQNGISMPSIRPMKLSKSVEMRWFSSVSRAWFRCASERRRSAGTRARHSCGPAPPAAGRDAFRRPDRRRGHDRAGRSIAWSSAPAERGESQRPKARKSARSSGAPLSGGKAPSSSGLASLSDHTTTRWSRRLSRPSDRCRLALRSAMTARSSVFCLEMRPRSRIR